MLDQGKSLLETETKRANDEAEARQRLESMLAAEMKKEEDMVGCFGFDDCPSCEWLNANNEFEKT